MSYLSTIYSLRCSIFCVDLIYCTIVNGSPQGLKGAIPPRVQLIISIHRKSIIRAHDLIVDDIPSISQMCIFWATGPLVVWINIVQGVVTLRYFVQPPSPLQNLLQQLLCTVTGNQCLIKSCFNAGIKLPSSFTTTNSFQRRVQAVLIIIKF